MSFEETFDELMEYIEKMSKFGNGRPTLTNYLAKNIRSMLRQFSKEEIEIAIDIAIARGGHTNWAKYIWGILWNRKRESEK